MGILLQRVSHASIAVEGKQISAIQRGLLVFAGVEAQDREETVCKMADRLVHYRLFSDATGKMNLSVQDINGGVLLVPQFTLAADTSRGRRPGFSRAAEPVLGERLFRRFCEEVRKIHAQVAWGVFATDMQVSLVNEGPVTFLLRS